MSSEAVRFLQHENARLHSEAQVQQAQIQNLQTYIQALADLYWASHNIAKNGTTFEDLDRLFEEIIAVVDSQDGSLLKLDPETEELKFVLVHGQLREELPGHCIPSTTGVAGWVLQNQQPVIVNEPHQDWRFSFDVDQEFAFLTQSILCVPVRCGDTLLGIIEFINKEPNKFIDSDLILAQVLAHIAAMALTGDNTCPVYKPAPVNDVSMDLLDNVDIEPLAQEDHEKP